MKHLILMALAILIPSVALAQYVGYTTVRAEDSYSRRNDYDTNAAQWERNRQEDQQRQYEQQQRELDSYRNASPYERMVEHSNFLGAPSK